MVHNNPLTRRRSELATGEFGKGNEDLDAHIRGLNALNTGRYWFAIGEPGKRTVDSMPLEMAEAKGLLRPEYRRAA